MSDNKKTCAECGDHSILFAQTVYFMKIRGKDYCTSCGTRIIDNAVKDIMITTTNSIDGYLIKEYVCIESVEIVIGTGAFSEFSSSLADMFGERSTEFEKKLQSAKKIALKKLKALAYEYDANAVIGVDLDYVEFSNNRIGVVANGTIVKIEKVS